MNKKMHLIISADSVCDLPEKLIKKYNIAISHYRVQTETGRFVDGVEIDTNDLINHMEKCDEEIKSEPPTVDEYREYFINQLEKAQYIIHFTMGKNSSEGYKNAREAVKNLGKVKIIDSGHISSGMGLIVLKAAMLADEGYGKDEIIENVEAAKMAVSSTFVIKETEFLYKSGRLSKNTKVICDRLLLHPMMKMKKSKITVGNVWMGKWKNVIDRYIDYCITNVSDIDKDILFVTHANLDVNTLEYIKERILSKCSFKEIYFQKATSAISCNCGKGTFGLLFMKKYALKRKENEKKVNIIKRASEGAKNFFVDNIIKEGYEIKHKLLNLILFAAIIGGTLSLLVTFVMKAYKSTAIIAVLLGVVFISLYISIKRNNPNVAGLIICFVANVVIFPLMFFTSGGVFSGMPMWFVLGLIFSWLLLDGWKCFGMYLLNLVAMLWCILYADKHPKSLTQMDEGYMVSDIIQTMIIVSCIFGIIFKFQEHVYEKQRKQLEEHEKELLAANNAKSTFLANMSHEIRTPINGIIGMDTMLLRECHDNETLKEYGKNIQSASQTLLSIVNDILDISKIESGKLEIVPVDYELFSILNDCYNMTAVRAAEKNLEFNINVNPNIPAGLYGDEVRVRQIINNLLSNAVKYTEEGSVELNVDYEMKSDATIILVITVSDTGIGIREEDMDKLFENFTRVDEKKNHNIEGTGLGLNLTRNLVEMMRGSVSVESVYGQGSVFRAKIMQTIRNREPMGDFSRKYQQMVSESREALLEMHVKDTRVLVVDDVPMNLLVAKGLIKYTEALVDTADSGAEALKMLEKTKYDIIFLDHLMPVMDGIEVFHRMKEIKGGPNITTPVIILTANAILGAREEYLNVGFTDYLPKPIKENELRSMLAKYLPEDKVILEGKSEYSDNNSVNSEKKATFCQILESSGIINTKEGLGYCMDDEDFYREIVQQYYDDNKGALLDDFFGKEDWENYRITVHSIKSTSLTLGAKELSEMAKASESACKEDNISYVKEKHEPVMEMYKKLRSAIETALSAEN